MRDYDDDEDGDEEYIEFLKKIKKHACDSINALLKDDEKKGMFLLGFLTRCLNSEISNREKK